jgi:four helix bundle protein
VYALTSGKGWDFCLRDQMRRSALSVVSNIAEGSERGSDADFGRFLRMACGSCAELRAQAIIAHDWSVLGLADFTHLHHELIELTAMLRAFVANLARKDPSA